jgi:uncharacterized protein (DUF1778 family)
LYHGPMARVATYWVDDRRPGGLTFSHARHIRVFLCYRCAYRRTKVPTKQRAVATRRRSVSRTERLALRTTSDQRDLLLAASQTTGVTLSEFVLSHATRAAEGVLADRQTFRLGRSAWDDFLAALDRPAQDVPRLRELLGGSNALDG